MSTIAEKLAYLKETKRLIKEKLIGKGVTITDDDSFRSYADKIDEITSGPDWKQITDWRYFSYNNNRNSIVAKLKYSDTSNGTNFSNMFSDCRELTTIPQLDTSSGTSFRYMFSNCKALTTIPLLNMSNMSGSNWSNMFYYCTALENVTFEGTIPVRGNMTVFSTCPNLTVESLMCFINALVKAGTASTYTITIGSTNLAKLSEAQKQIATDKGIILA